MSAKGTTPQTTIDRYKKIARVYIRNGFNKAKAIQEVMPDMSWASCQSNTYNIFNHKVTQDEVERLLRKAAATENIGPERVLRMLATYAEAGMMLAKFKKVNEDGGVEWDFTGATEEELITINQIETTVTKDGDRKSKVAMSDPLAAIDKLARIHGMYSDNLNVSTEVSLIDRINASRARISQPGTVDAIDVVEEGDEEDDGIT